MATFIVTSKATGVEVYRYEAEAAIEWAGFEFEAHDHTEFVSPPAPPVLIQPRRFTKLGFIALLTPEEFVGMLDAARESAAVEALIKMIDWATPDHDQTAIDRDDPRTISGVRAYFPPDRADAILGVA